MRVGSDVDVCVSRSRGVVSGVRSVDIGDALCLAGEAMMGSVSASIAPVVGDECCQSVKTVSDQIDQWAHNLQIVTRQLRSVDTEIGSDFQVSGGGLLS